MKTKKDFYLHISEYLRIQREKNDLSFDKLSKEVNISSSVLYSLETDNKINPKIRTLEKILNYYNLSFFDLFNYIYGEDKNRNL